MKKRARVTEEEEEKDDSPSRSSGSKKRNVAVIIADPVAWVFRDANVVTKLLIPHLDMVSMARLSLCNSRLQEILGKHYDLVFMRKMVAPAVIIHHGKTFFMGRSYRGEVLEDGTAMTFLKTRSPHYLQQLYAVYGEGSGRDVSRLLRFFFPPNGPQHVYVQKFIEMANPFLLVASMRLFSRITRLFYYEELMWWVMLQNYVSSAERFLPMVTALERMAEQDGKKTFRWESPRLARTLYSARDAMRGGLFGPRMQNSGVHAAAMAWLDERVALSTQHPDAEIHARVQAAIPRLGGGY